MIYLEPIGEGKSLSRGEGFRERVTKIEARWAARVLKVFYNERMLNY